MLIMPVNSHTRAAYQCEELRLMFLRTGNAKAAKFWGVLRDEKFEDARLEPTIRYREGRSKARLLLLLRRGRIGDSSGASDDDHGIDED